jgi:hypothetical protein
MTYHKMIVSTLAGFFYGPMLWFLTDLSIMSNLGKKDGTYLFQRCGFITNTLFACCAYYYIMNVHGHLLRAEAATNRLGPVNFIYFGFLFPSLIAYPSVMVCGGPYWFQHILYSHPVMICLGMVSESIGFHEWLGLIFRIQDAVPVQRRA